MAQVGADANWNRDKAPEYPAAAGTKTSTDARPAVEAQRGCKLVRCLPINLGPSGIDFVLHVTLSVAFNFGTVRATDDDTLAERDNSTGFEDLDELFPGSNPTHVAAVATEKPAEKSPGKDDDKDDDK